MLAILTSSAGGTNQSGISITPVCETIFDSRLAKWVPASKTRSSSSAAKSYESLLSSVSITSSAGTLTSVSSGTEEKLW